MKQAYMKASDLNDSCAQGAFHMVLTPWYVNPPENTGTERGCEWGYAEGGKRTRTATPLHWILSFQQRAWGVFRSSLSLRD